MSEACKLPLLVKKATTSKNDFSSSGSVLILLLQKINCVLTIARHTIFLVT